MRSRLRGDKVSELFRTGEWIRRRSNCRREMFDRLLLFGWLLSQRDPIELSCEGVMRRSQVCKHQVCDHCGRTVRRGDASLVGQQVLQEDVQERLPPRKSPHPVRLAYSPFAARMNFNCLFASVLTLCEPGELLRCLRLPETVKIG